MNHIPIFLSKVSYRMNPISEIISDYTKSVALVPVLAMTGTLAIIEALQAYFYYDKKELVGYADKIYLAPVRTTKMLSVKEWDITKTGLKHNKCIAVYLKNPELSRLYGNTKLGSKLTSISTKFTDTSCQKLCLSCEGHQDLTIHLQTIASSERIYGLKFGELLSDNREYLRVGDEADKWMSAVLDGQPVSLLYIPNSKLSGNMNFPVYRASDGMPAAVPPVLITSVSTLERMNTEAETNVEMERFRPNIVVKGCSSRAENFWKVIRIGSQLELEQIFMSPRCGVVNAFKGDLNKKVLDVVYKHGPFRDTKKRPCFGSYWKVLRPGKVEVGDKIVLLKSIDCEITGPYHLSDDFIMG